MKRARSTAARASCAGRGTESSDPETWSDVELREVSIGRVR